MNKYKCKKCGEVVEETETRIVAGEGKVSMNPSNPDEQTSFPRPVRLHTKDDGEVTPL
jgi:hypothetical protein